jgi:hypothetical protein
MTSRKSCKEKDRRGMEEWPAPRGLAAEELDALF